MAKLVLLSEGLTGKTYELAVEKTSYADQAGVKAGDEIVAVGNLPMHDGDLSAFASAFSSVKAAAHENEQSSFPMTIRNAGGTHTIAVGMPPSIKSFLNGAL